jgi:hypothetical protein
MPNKPKSPSHSDLTPISEILNLLGWPPPDAHQPARPILPTNSSANLTPTEYEEATKALAKRLGV